MLPKIFFAVMIYFLSSYASAGTLDEVKKRDILHCGVSKGLLGFSDVGDNGEWSGLDVDFCRAIAAVVLGDAKKVKYFPSTSIDRFKSLQEGIVDVVSHNATWTLTRDTSMDIQFVGVIYYDGQGIMVPRSLNITSVTELDGANICTDAGTTTVQNLSDYFESKNMSFHMVSYESTGEVVAAYDAGQCDVYTTDVSALAAQRKKLKNPAEHVILPDVISREPLGPYVRNNDAQWFNVARWTLFALINAEVLGIMSTVIDDIRQSSDPAIQRFIGEESVLGYNMGLSDDWAYNAIKQVGNYGEIFYRNIGRKSQLILLRGRNALWTQGGLLYSPPIR